MIATGGSEMGFRKPMDYYAISHQIHMAGVELNSSMNDGFTQFEIKKELFKLKWLIDGILSSSSKFEGEEQFIKEHSQQQMLNILKHNFGTNK